MAINFNKRIKMEDFMQKQKDDFDDYVAKWDKAVEQGVFKGPELPKVNPQTAQDSFFGLLNTNPTADVSLSDSEYWKAIYSASTDHNPENPDVISEADEHQSNPVNPQARGSLGIDQDMDPQQLGLTYSKEDVEKLSELKKELYSLESKLLTSMGFGDEKNNKKIQTKIESVKVEINKLSDAMGRPYKNNNQPKHLKNL